jgi:hypothetical protein
LLGVLLAVGVALVQIVGLYVLLLVRWAVGGADAPGMGGLVGFVAAHGGAVFANVPPVPALFGIGGSLKIDPPITSIAALPFALMLVGSWVLSRRERKFVVFALVAPVCYSLTLAVLALLFRMTSSGDGAEITVSALPLSAALHGLLVAGLGILVGSVAARGPFLPDRARQVLRGGLAAVGVSVVLTVLLAIMLLAQAAFSGNPLEDLRQNGGSQPQSKNAQPEEHQPNDGGAGDAIGAVAGVTGGVFALLPASMGTLWLLAHGLPVGFQHAPDLGALPLIGGMLKNVNLSPSLLVDWPLAGTWRLLMLAPVAGLALGGAIAAHGAPPSHRWRYGALIAVPYTTILLLTAVLARLSVSLSASALKLDIVFGASIAWALLVLPVAAGLGAAGALLARQGAVPAPRPRWVGAITVCACGLLLLGTAPLVASSTSDVPAPEKALAPKPGSEAKSGGPLPDSKEPDPSPKKIPKPKFSPPKKPKVLDAPQVAPTAAQQRFVSSYYAAVGREDWVATYSLLDPSSRSQVPGKEWIREQQARSDASDKPPVRSAQITQISKQPGSFKLTVELTHEDGTKTTASGVVIHELDGGYKRHLTPEELSGGPPL